MWDHMPDGHYIFPDQHRLDLQKKLALFSNEELLKYVRAYERWLDDGNMNSFSSVFIGYYSMASENNNVPSLKLYLEEYDAICREIARRWVLKKL
jgi:hypothetical protein